MSGPDGIILGFDPGGKNAFGWSICRTKGGQLQKPCTAGNADDALSVLQAVEGYVEKDSNLRDLRVLAAGIDAPMFWSRRGNRKVDDYLRRHLKSARLTSSIMQVNSLQGAALVQGVLLGKLLRDTWDLRITESHPKAVEYLIWHSNQSTLIEMMGKVIEGLKQQKYGGQGKEDARLSHMRDATLAAISAWAMVHEHPNWQNLYEREPQPVQPFGTPVAYWMPVPHEAQPS